MKRTRSFDVRENLNKYIKGDSDKILPEIGDNSVDIILTDPLYNFKSLHIEYYLREFKRIARDWVIVFYPPENQWPNADQHLFWIKPESTKNTVKSYSRYVEMIGVWRLKPDAYWEGGADKTIRNHWTQFTNIFNDRVVNSTLHPWKKPESLIERLILNHTKAGDVLLDPFAGSGTVGDVAKRNHRGFICIDLEQGHNIKNPGSIVTDIHRRNQNEK